MDIAASPEIKKYFKSLRKDIEKSYNIANEARSKKLDPEDKPEIILANTMADRVLGLVSMVAPQIFDTKIPERIIELEEEYGALDWRVGFKIAEEVAKENFCKFKDKREAMEVGIRTGFAYLTLGIVAAPLEGFIGLEIKKRKDGKEFLAIKYAGPIRGAGGTASSTSVILSDYVRVKMGYAPYDPDEKEINRYVTEINDYHERVTNLQYRPSEEELKFMQSHLPVQVDGDPTEKIEVSNYKDLPRIDTNLIRGGVALVMAEGLCQKAPKLWKRLSKWGKDFDLEWDFLGEFLKLKDKIHASHSAEKSKSKKNKKENKKEVKANNTFISDIVAGRPILTHPIREGGFRLRYGRGRTSGFSASAAHPATLIVLDKFIAIGTQLKVERPGKAATITLCDTIEGPIVRLTNGNVLHLTSETEANSVVKEVEEILFLGDILFNYGDFSENGHSLVPAGYCPEWWVLELEKQIIEKFGSKEDLPGKLSDKIISNAAKELNVEDKYLKELLENILFTQISWKDSINFSEKIGVPLHPNHLFYWKLISYQDLTKLVKYLKEGKVKKETSDDFEKIKKIVLPYYTNKEYHVAAKKILEKLGVVHSVVNNESIVVGKVEANILGHCLGFFDQASLLELNLREKEDFETALDYLKDNLSVIIKDKAGTFIGARMGRPEKAKMRSMTGKPHAMFPVGDEGDRLRSFQSALKAGKVTSEFPLFYCESCKKNSVYRICDDCGDDCIQQYYCRFCGGLKEDKCAHERRYTSKRQEIDIKHYFDKAKGRLKEKIYPDLIKGVRGTSNKEHLVEHLFKGILRAKHNVYVNKDGTTRYDCTELPLTHFKPKEIGTSVEKLKKCGYEKDIFGKTIENDDQIIELRPQDVILPGLNLLEESSANVLLRMTKFIDELLTNFYGLKPFYKAKTSEDLVGHLVIGLAPHISAGTVGRIIGFSQTQGLLAHPMYHAGLRRDCDGDEAAVMLLMDGLLNFSKKFLPSSRGSTMDAALVLTPILKPAEVDDQVLGVDMEWRYPLEFYEAALEMKNPWDVKYGPKNKKIEQLDDNLNTEKQYQGFGFMHHIDNFNKGVICSAYKILPSMKEKLFGQMEIARKVRAVDMGDVARMTIQKHFLADIKGNLRKFSMQGFRCGKCNTKYRRPPINNKCRGCSTGKIIFTISEGSVVKYLEPSLELAKEYDFSPYLKQTINLLKYNVDVVFGRDKDKQVGLGAFMVK